jgi:hypothetical protein
MTLITPSAHRPSNKGILVGQKRPLQPKNVWSIRVRLEMSGTGRELALFNLAIENLEQLRAIEYGMRIDATVIQTEPLGVDTLADLERARALLSVQVS